LFCLRGLILNPSQQKITENGKRRNAMRSFATFVSSTARGLYLRYASTFKIATIAVVIATFAIFLSGCNGSSTGGGGQTQSTQTITFTQPTSPVVYAPELTIALSATGGGSGNPVVFTVDSTSTGKGTVSGNTLTVANAGKIIVDANQAGNSNYYAADQVQATIVVNPATPTISALPVATAIVSGQALSASTLSGGTASVSGTFAWTTSTTVPPIGTDSESVTFTPTDTIDYATVTAEVSVVVNPATPQITGGTRYSVSDTYSLTVPETLTCEGCQAGDILHDANGIFGDLTLPSAETTLNFTNAWEEGNFQPACDGSEIQHPGGSYGNIWNDCFLGSASQSTLAISATTGTLFQIEQGSGQVYTLTTNGTAGTIFSSSNGGNSLDNIAIDDVSGNVAYLWEGNSPEVGVFKESGNNGNFASCYVKLTGMSSASSIAAKGGYMVFTDPVGNLFGIAKTDCTGFVTFPIAGQPWAAAMSGSDAYILSRDDGGNGVPRITKISVPSGTTEGFVDLVDMPTVTSCRAVTPYGCIHQVTAFNTASVANVLFMSDTTDGTVLTISTNTSNGAKMAVTYTTPITDIPVIIAPQESGNVTSPVLWIGYLSADSGDNVMNVGALDPSTGSYTSAVGACQAGLVGGFAASSNGLQCAQGGTIGSPLVLPYSTY
jgi:hypothetical protein